MASNKIINIEPAAIASSPANILNFNITSLSGPVGITLTQPYVVLNHVRIVNTTAAAIVVSLWKGVTAGHAAGTEWMLSGYTIGSNGSGANYVDIYTKARFDSADFLVGSGSNTGLTLVANGEIGFS